MSVENTQREKLIDLIVNAKKACPETESFTEFLAGFLIGYGVIVPDNTYDFSRLRDLVQAEMEGRAPVAQARWTNHCCTACGKQAVTCTFSDGTTVYIETPRCPSCGARMNEVEP